MVADARGERHLKGFCSLFYRLSGLLDILFSQLQVLFGLIDCLLGGFDLQLLHPGIFHGQAIISLAHNVVG